MRLAAFLRDDENRIVDEAVDFARSVPSLRGRDMISLRNHFPDMLRAISRDLEQGQSCAESFAKSRGNVTVPAEGTPATDHGRFRARLGLDVDELVSEYRALRASVLRLWADAAPPGPEALRDITRFNEAVDQALTESVHVYSVERLLQSVLGHGARHARRGANGDRTDPQR